MSTWQSVFITLVEKHDNTVDIPWIISSIESYITKNDNGLTTSEGVIILPVFLSTYVVACYVIVPDKRIVYYLQDDDMTGAANDLEEFSLSEEEAMLVEETKWPDFSGNIIERCKKTFAWFHLKLPT
jgi:hypothetical protein